MDERLEQINLEMLTLLSGELSSLFKSASFQPFPKCWGGAPPRERRRSARGRKRALYESITGIKMIRIGRFNRYIKRIPNAETAPESTWTKTP